MQSKNDKKQSDVLSFKQCRKQNYDWKTSFDRM